MNNPVVLEEFIGRFGISYKEGETVYAYDDITHGLYKFTLNIRKVDMIISPESIHRNTEDRIMGISKRGNEIILIPLFLDTEWIFYDEKEKKIRYESMVERKIRISSAITVETNLFLIPSCIYDPVIIVSLDCMKKIKIYENWYGKNGNRERDNILIWGASSHRNFVVFPIVNSKKIACLNCDEINVIMPNIPDPFLSVSIYEDKIWILPVSGEHIYGINFNGEILDRVNLSQIKSEISASELNRIIALEDTIFLLPKHGENIYAYQLKKKKLVQIKTGSAPLEGGLFARTGTPYWDFVIEKDMLHFLPCEYRYKRIQVSSLENREYALCYGNNINREKYWKMIRYVHKDSLAEEKESDLLDFFQYVFPCENHLIGENKKIGRKHMGTYDRDYLVNRICEI